MASQTFQERNGVGGTSASYVVAAELLEGAAECVEKAQAPHAAATALTADARSRVLELAIALDAPAAVGIEQMKWPELVKNAGWHRIRNCAASVLAAMSFDLSRWETENALR